MKFQKSPGWGASYFDVEDAPYVDRNYNTFALDRVMTGVCLYKKQNRISIKLQSALINPQTKLIDNLSKTWSNNPGWGEDPKDFFDTRDGIHYLNTSGCTPTPESFLTGAALRQYGNQIALQVRHSV